MPLIKIQASLMTNTTNRLGATSIIAQKIYIEGWSIFSSILLASCPVKIKAALSQDYQGISSQIILQRVQTQCQN